MASSPSVDDVRRIIQGLCELAGGEGPGLTTFREGIDAPRAIAIQTHANHAVRLAQALLACDGPMCGIEIVPLVRAIFEAGVTAAWLLLTERSGQTLMKQGAIDRRRALEGLPRHGEEPGPALEEVRSLIATLDVAEAPQSFAFEQRCLRLKDGPLYYTIYRVLSSQSHAGVGVVDAYVVPMPESPVGIAFDGQARLPNREAAVGWAAVMLLLALASFDCSLRTSGWREALVRAGTELGVGIRVVAADGFEWPEN